MAFWQALERTFEEPLAKKKAVGEACSPGDCGDNAVCDYLYQGDGGMRCRCHAPAYAHKGRCVHEH